MKAVRRFYFYALTLISLELVVWGLYTLISAIWRTTEAIGFNDILASGLAQILIGLPIFVFHARIIQRDAIKEEEENLSLIRAIFIDIVRLISLGAVMVNSINLIDQLLQEVVPSQYIQACNMNCSDAKDSITIILINLLVWMLAERILNSGQAIPQEFENQIKIRRIYRYVWLISAIVTLVYSIQSLLQEIIFNITSMVSQSAHLSTEYIAMILVSAVIWAWTWRLLQNSYKTAEEKNAGIRYVVFFGITFVSIAIVLSVCGILIHKLLGWLLGTPYTLQNFINHFSSEIALIVPSSILWAYYGQKLTDAIEHAPEAYLQFLYRRIFSSVLSLAGSILTFIGLQYLFGECIDLIFGYRQLGPGAWNQFTTGIALLLLGVPLWIRHWKILQNEVSQENDYGSTARASTLRRVYLYLIVFGSVLGAMIVAGALIYQLINAAVGNSMSNLGHFTVNQIVFTIQFVVWLLYHRSIMQTDNQSIQITTENRFTAFATLIFESEEEVSLIDKIAIHITRKMPDLPIKRMQTTQEFTAADIALFPIVLVSTQTLMEFSAKQQKILKGFTGKILVLPVITNQLININVLTQNDLIKSTLEILHQIIEGQQIKPAHTRNGWVIAGYIFAALFALYFLLIGVSIFLG
ncbi:MAG: hypothetical protein JEZ00_07505 [Anaerolineaceae bacterium]|nr:hypothetical protein [Anaerolineaceae bacterium]